MSIESGLAKRPLLKRGSWKCLMAWDMQALCLTASRDCRGKDGRDLVLSVENQAVSPVLRIVMWWRLPVMWMKPGFIR